jgi:hypothetical protein
MNGETSLSVKTKLQQTIVGRRGGGKNRAYVQDNTVKLQERFLRKFNIYIYIYIRHKRVTHNKTVIFLITEV